MEDQYRPDERASFGTAFEFEGRWGEYIPIAVTNFLLTIVTLGIYRFWAKARERRYLWSRTRFIDDHFEWTGTGKEMFFGFLIVIAILLPIFLIFQFVVQGLILRGRAGEAAFIAAILYLAIFYLVGVAGFRALRYRLTRTYWHGIRGGSDDSGWGYGVQWVGRTLFGILPFGLLIPWSMTSLWNLRWSRMSFGQYMFEANATAQGLWARWLLIYFVPFAAMLLVPVFGFGAMAAAGGNPGNLGGFFLTFFLMAIGFYLLVILVSLSYYAAFFRHVAEATSVAGIEFEFTAHTTDWLKLILGNILLVIFTLGLGLLVLPFRNWSFVIEHMEARGEIHVDRLLQSAARSPGDAEGMADAFDIGAI